MADPPRFLAGVRAHASHAWGQWFKSIIAHIFLFEEINERISFTAGVAFLYCPRGAKHADHRPLYFGLAFQNAKRPLYFDLPDHRLYPRPRLAGEKIISLFYIS